MRKFKMVAFVLTIAISSFALGQETNKWNNSALEKELWDVETQQWLNFKLPSKESLRVRFASWTDQFMEIYPNGDVHFKADMMASQSATPFPPGTGAFPEDFKLRAVYGDFALGTDTTTIKGVAGSNGVYRGLRMFVKENGKWRVAGAMFTPLPKR